MSIWIFFRLIGALALLMFGMKTMSDSLQKMAGPQLRHVLGTPPAFVLSQDQTLKNLYLNSEELKSSF